MTPELAKELKAAGYPQDGEGHYFTNRSPEQAWGKIEHSDTQTRNPSLQEIVEACGEAFVEIVQDTDDNYCLAVARVIDGNEKSDTITAKGKNSVEAVARLWLALNNRGAAGSATDVSASS